MEKPNPFAAISSNEEDEDTISLSGLLMYCDKNIEFWVEDQSMSYDTEQDFEFSSEIMITCQDPSNPVVFCGKVIQLSPEKIQKFQSKKQQKQCKRPGTSVVRKVSILSSKTKSRWCYFMFGFGSNRYPKKMHIRDLRERKTSVQRKCADCNICHERDDSRMRSSGFIRFLGCGGSGTKIDDDETPCKLHYQTWMDSQ